MREQHITQHIDGLERHVSAVQADVCLLLTRQVIRLMGANDQSTEKLQLFMQNVVEHRKLKERKKSMEISVTISPVFKEHNSKRYS